jgi:hypothetical protein
MKKVDGGLHAESRRAAATKRTAMLLDVTCVGSDGEQAVIRVRNLSETGLGGDVTKGLIPLEAQMVTVSLRDDQKTRGTIIWTEGKQLGIAFAQLLDMQSLKQSWTGPRFEVDARHKVDGSACHRPGLALR